MKYLCILIFIFIFSFIHSVDYIELHLDSLMHFESETEKMYFHINLKGTFPFLLIYTEPTESTNPAKPHTPNTQPFVSSEIHSKKQGVNALDIERSQFIGNDLYILALCFEKCKFNIVNARFVQRIIIPQYNLTMPSVSVSETEGADYYFTVSQEMITKKKRLFFYGYSNDDDIYENSKTNMKIYYNDNIEADLQRMFNQIISIRCVNWKMELLHYVQK